MSNYHLLFGMNRWLWFRVQLVCELTGVSEHKVRKCLVWSILEKPTDNAWRRLLMSCHKIRRIEDASKRCAVAQECFGRHGLYIMPFIMESERLQRQSFTEAVGRFFDAIVESFKDDCKRLKRWLT